MARQSDVRCLAVPRLEQTIGMTAGTHDHRVAAVAETTARWRGAIGRAGLIALGVVSFILGLLAVQFARGGTKSAEGVSETGAIEKLADQPFGKFLLVALTVGLAALVLWYVIIAVTGDPVQGSGAKVRVLAAVSAVISLGLFLSALKITIDNWNGGGTEGQQGGGGGAEQQQATDTIFDLPGGRFLIVLLGVVLLGVGAFQFFKHVIKADFMERLHVEGRAERPTRVAGQSGYGAKAMVLGLTGVFFATAAIAYDPEQPKDLSGVLAELAGHAWGKVLLWVIAIGLALFGLFCFAEAKYRRAV